MHYVIIRDDDTNAFTPPECLEQLYRPFLERGLPVNLAVIPDVALGARMGNGRPEGFLVKKPIVETGSAGDAQGGLSERAGSPGLLEREVETTTRAVGSNRALVRYLHENPGFKIVQHGCHHDYHEFDRRDRRQVALRLDRGRELLVEAGFAPPQTFVAPYDKFSRISMAEVQRRFRVISTGWFEAKRLPYSWWPRYVLKKIRHSPHWIVRNTILLSHPGCLLSCHRTYSTMMGGILHQLKTQRLTVLVTHWWEYFREGLPDTALSDFLHETANHLATCPNIKVISFEDLATGSIALN